MSKKVRLILSAFTRVEYAAEVEVADDISEEALNKMVEDLYDDVNRSWYYDDPYYWSRGDCHWEDA